MKMKELTNEYIAGYLENTGGFYIMNINDRKTQTPQFKIAVQKHIIDKVKLTENIVKFLRDRYNINFNQWDDGTQFVWHTTSRPNLKRLIEFMTFNCRLDKRNLKEVIDVIAKADAKENKKKAKDE